MFDLLLNTPFICNANWKVVKFDTNFYRKLFSKQAIEIWILILIIPIIYAKISTVKYDKIWIFRKNAHENYHRWKKSWVKWSGISLFFSKSMPWLVWVYIGSFFNPYMSHFLDIDETINFRNFRKLFTNKFAAFFVGFWHPIFKREKRNEMIGRRKHAAMAVSSS